MTNNPSHTPSRKPRREHCTQAPIRIPCAHMCKVLLCSTQQAYTEQKVNMAQSMHMYIRVQARVHTEEHFLI